MSNKYQATIRDPHLAMKDIWRHHPELQNWSSSSWWFFVFFPEQKEGYGPKQMMFTFASRVGDLIKVNSTWQKGIDRNRKLEKTEEFMTRVVGWIYDGKTMHEDIVNQTANAKLSYKNQVLEAWEKQRDGSSHGAKIAQSNSHDFAIDGHFKGKKGEARFTIWSSGDSEIEIPQIFDFRGPNKGKLGGTQHVAWRKISFEGEFTSPNGTEQLSGHGYFQRVLMNVPMFPWKWCYLLFEDGSVFSSFVPYFGIQNFRRTSKFFPQIIERAVIPLAPRAYFLNKKSGIIIHFDTANIYPVINKTDKPNFHLICKSKKGDFLQLKLNSHSHAKFLLDRSVVKHMWQTKYIYNEYLIKLSGLRGRIDGKPFNSINHGKAWGNMEYTWGMSL